MERGQVKSARGVYYDLSKSPHEYRTPCGDLLRFSSRKKLDMYTRDVVKELERIMRALERNDLINYLPEDTLEVVVNQVYVAFYLAVER